MRGAGVVLGFSLMLCHLAVGGCALMQASGASSWDVWAGQHDPKNIPYAFVRVRQRTTSVLSESGAQADHRLYRSEPSTDIRFGIGDISV